MAKNVFKSIARKYGSGKPARGAKHIPGGKAPARHSGQKSGMGGDAMKKGYTC